MAAEVGTKVQVCKKTVKDHTGKSGQCGMPLKGECRNKANHVRPFRTGFCTAGACEGKKKVSVSGRVMKPCLDWQHCPCDCHKQLDTLFAMTGKERTPQDMSGYEPPHNPYYMPSLEERALMHAMANNSTEEVAEVVVASPLPEVIPVTIKKTYNETKTGRAARGQLESWVREFCDEYLIEQYGEPCTPKFVAEQVAKAQGFATPPSQGAVDAVFKRWEAIGFATIGKKPTRFVGYTEEGIKLGLEAMKIREKDRARSAAAAAGRSFRRK